MRNAVETKQETPWTQLWCTVTHLMFDRIFRIYMICRMYLVNLVNPEILLTTAQHQASTAPPCTLAATRASLHRARRKHSVAPALPCTARALHHASPPHRTTARHKDAPS